MDTHMRTLTLLLMRHGQAEFRNPSGDRERSLTPRGKLQVQSTGKQLQQHQLSPTLALVSEAQRTQDTASLLQSLWPSAHWKTLQQLYLATPFSTLQLLDEEELSSHDTLLLVGHNPGFSELATHFSDVRVGLDTASAAWLELDASSWKEALQMNGLWQLREVVHSGV